MAQIFYYAHTGHRIGLDRFHRAAAIINALPELDITLLTSDYRIAQIAHTYGVKRSVGVDVVRNIPQIANNGDILIFDSAEANPAMLADMQRYFSKFIRISDDPEDQVYPGEYLVNPYIEDENCCNALGVDPHYFEQGDKKDEKIFFFGDDDYEEDLLRYKSKLSDARLKLLLGFYFFIDYEEKLKDAFTDIIEPEEYTQSVKEASVFVTSSPVAALQALASGSSPIYIQREDYPKDFLLLFEKLNIPCLNYEGMENLDKIIGAIASHEYQVLNTDATDIAEFIQRVIN